MAEITNPELEKCYHVTLSSPVKQNLTQAIKKGYFATWPNLRSKLINKHILPSIATPKGHMYQTRKNLKYTKPQYPKPLEELLIKPLVQRTNTVFTKTIDHKRQIDTEPTGKSPVTSNRGNKYLFVLYDYDSNCTLIRPMKSRAYSKFIRLFTDPMRTYSPGGSSHHI